jgi:hypothetical protein
MMARSDLLHTRAGYRSARPITAILKIQLATHGRSIQSGQEPPSLGDVRHRILRATHDRRYLEALQAISDGLTD